MFQIGGPTQTTYNRYYSLGQVGTPASETGWTVDTAICQDDSSPAVGIGYGLAVGWGSDSDRAAYLGGTFRGITRANVSNSVLRFTDAYGDGDNMPIQTRGDIFVVAENAVTAGEAVYYNPSTGKLGHSGGTLIDGAVWLTTTAASAVGIVRLGSIAGNVGT
jgi:hypothetical protein